jgi:hypothetical protein
VFGLGDGYQVRGAVIRLTPIDMVDAVPGWDRANFAFIDEKLLPDIPMIGTRMAASKHHPIAIPIEVAATPPIRMGTSPSGSMSLPIETRPAAIPVVNRGCSWGKCCWQAAAAVTDTSHLCGQFWRRLLDRVLGRRPTVDACLGAKARASTLASTHRFIGLAAKLACVHATSIPPLSRRSNAW